MSIFTSITKKRQKRSTFDLSHDVKLSLDMGYVVPTYVQEVLPGDKTRISSSCMLRMAPLISPVMHRIGVKMEYFFVPNRILWKNWETFITGSRNGKVVEDDIIIPFIQPYGTEYAPVNGIGSLMDYMGLPTAADFETGEEPDSALGINALPFAAYQRIWDEYYRDENLIESMYDTVEFDNYNMLPDAITEEQTQQLLQIRPRCWEHDYFTSALPWAQKGEQVQIPVAQNFTIGFDPLEGQTDIKYRDSATGFPAGETALADTHLFNNNLGSPPYDALWYANSGGSQPFDQELSIDNSSQLFVQNEGGTGGTINDLRAAFKLQEWLETNARGGSRYFESIYAHFGLRTPDSRLQRPEYIGSYKSNMIISEVLQTSSPQTETDTPQGNMSGHGQNVSSTRSFSHYAQEHGFIIGVMSIMPRTAYQQGIPKHFGKIQNRLEFYFPEFAHLGEQEINIREIYAGAGATTTPFGYTPRYAEYKFMLSRVAGDFRDTLRYWHLGRYFESTPALNDFFVSSGQSIGKRIFAVQDLPASDDPEAEPLRNYHSIYGHVFHEVKCNRLMPKYGTPTI